ncbi:MAG: isoprenylcysteine carboxylmethyltransferase family protein [Methanoregula sp.]|jgi:protein-S-isoprenylcysteine O-methyltransferase Ste14
MSGERESKTMVTYLQIIAGIWAVFMAFLFIPALQVGAPVERRSSRYIQWSFIIAIIVMILVIILARYESQTLALRVIPDSPVAGITGIVLTIAGLGFSAWARRHLGKYWSSMVMVKVGHRIIRTGPYRIVRNPMYTGLLIAFVGAAIAIGELLAFVALIIGIVSVLVKIKAEEEILLEKFGEEYLQYKRDVGAAIIPWVV